MAMRRRIKVGVNLTAAKRKPKSDIENAPQEAEDKTTKAVEIEVPQRESAEPQQKKEKNEKPSKELLKAEQTADTQLIPDNAAFKCPPKVDFSRSNSYTSTHTLDDLNQESLNDGAQVMQMDLQRTANGFPLSPSSPSKTQQRQRIRPTPIFGQRRNSLIGAPPSPLLNECDSTEVAASPQKRERHYSGSQSHAVTHNHSISKVSNHSSGRVRTESTCSTFSDSHMSSTSKSRKTDDHNAHRSQARRDFEARFSNGIPEKSTLKMFDLIYYNPATNPMEQKSKMEEIKTESKEEKSSETETEEMKNTNSAVLVPQLKLNAKGELILDDKSLEIETTAEQEARKVLAKSSLIYLDENTGMNGFYKRQKRTRDWPPHETIRFYRCLKTIGTDFSMMCQLFPKRTRRDLKLKFKKEERCNGALINKALLHPNSFNIQELKDQFETEDREREEEERTKIAQKSIPYKKVSIKTSKSARALKNADDIYNHELQSIEAEKKKLQNKERKSNKETNEGESKEKSKRRTQTKTSKTGKLSNPELDADSVLNSTVKNEPSYNTEYSVESSLSKESINMNDTQQIPTNESIIITEQSPYEEVQYAEVLPINGSDYDRNRSNYEDKVGGAKKIFEFIDEQNLEDSRTFVNMDSGNVTLVRDSPSYTNVDEENVRPIQNSELINNDKTALSDISENQVFSMLTVDHAQDSEATIGTQNSSANENIIVTEEIDNKPTTSTATTTHSSSPFTVNDEAEIAKILENIANGSLVVVSTFSPSAPDELINEIYMLDPNTGELCEEPLDLPQEIIQSILSVMT